MEIDRRSHERSVRTLLVSDIHLGYRFAQAEHFATYLDQVRPEQLYILGDFLDGWKLASRWTWKPVYSRILNRLFDLAEGGTELFYTPGNHDAFLRCPDIMRLLRKSGLCVNTRDEFVYETQAGRRFIVMHGDSFDIVEMHYQRLSMLLTYVYEPLLAMNWCFNRLSRGTQSPYAACSVIKGKVKAAVRFFSHFEDNLFRYVRDRDCDGVICGHIHTPGFLASSSATYINTGDWVENCTALVENHAGELVIESFFPNRPFQKVASPEEESVAPAALLELAHSPILANVAARLA